MSTTVVSLTSHTFFPGGKPSQSNVLFNKQDVYFLYLLTILAVSDCGHIHEKLVVHNETEAQGGGFVTVSKCHLLVASSTPLLSSVGTHQGPSR